MLAFIYLFFFPHRQRQNLLLHLDEQTRSLERHFRGKAGIKEHANNFYEASRK